LPSGEDEHVLRVLLAAMLAAGGAERLDAPPRGPGVAVSSGAADWADVRDEVRTFVLASIRRDGALTAQAAKTATLLNTPHAVESFKTLGNRWTDQDDESSERDRLISNRERDLASAEWVRSLAAQSGSGRADVAERPWYRSKVGARATAPRAPPPPPRPPPPAQPARAHAAREPPAAPDRRA